MPRKYKGKPTNDLIEEALKSFDIRFKHNKIKLKKNTSAYAYCKFLENEVYEAREKYKKLRNDLRDLLK